MTHQQSDLELKNFDSPDEGPVTCLGMTFENDEARRAHFTEELREKLKESEFRKIEGFPIGEDEDILALSDPPYYTACPNPWIADFIKEWDAQKPEKPEDYQYHREPFAADISAGKNDPIYNAHSYHTKVPHKAIMRYILHYTEPGDIVFDGFCGTGMTGVAAQMCGDRTVVMSLGYQVKPDGTILQEELNERGKSVWRPFSKVGVRRAVLSDLSPAATFISKSYNAPTNVARFQKEATRILMEVEQECGWMYETLHTDKKSKGKIKYVVWSDVFICQECAGEVIFWTEAVDKKKGTVRESFPCPHCSANLTKRSMERSWASETDESINKIVRHAKQVPVLISYSVAKKRFEKKPDEQDIALIKKIGNSTIPYWFPLIELPDGSNTRQPKLSHGISHLHHFYTKRNLWVLAAVADRCRRLSNPKLMAWLTSAMIRTTKMYKYMPSLNGGKLVDRRTGTVNGTLYIPSMSDENSVFPLLESKIKDFSFSLSENAATSCQSSTDFDGDYRFDYIFVDPPFGANINYSELNFIWEPWLSVITNNQHEAIENTVQGKSGFDYRSLMLSCFQEFYNKLKPGCWMTIEFSNTKATVWNSIQTAIAEAGFIIANVSALDKKQGSFKAVTTPTAVKQDLIISAYKPNGGFEKRFQDKARTEDGVWDFVRTHLKYLPVTKKQGALLQFVPERDPRILYDQTVAYFVRKGYPVPISSREFQIGLGQRFIERDGMYFLPDQAAEHDQKKVAAGETVQASLFVSDEESAIQWLRQMLKLKPQTFSDLNPQFMQQLGGWSKNEAQLDLRELLNQNFLVYDGKGLVPDQLHSYLSSNWKGLRNLAKDAPELTAKAKDRWYVPDPSKAGDLEKLRERALLKEFETYVQRKKAFSARDKFRLEALRAGFKKAWQNREYGLILDVAAKIPDKILEEDPKLLMWRDNAQTRLGDD